MKEEKIMDLHWSLQELYTSFDAPAFKKDWEAFIAYIEKIKNWADTNLLNTDDAVAKIDQYIQMQNEFGHLSSKLFQYAELTLSIDAKNETALQIIERLEECMTELSKPSVQFQKWVGTLTNLEALLETSPILKEHRFHLLDQAKHSRYLLSDEEEVVLSKMKNTGSAAWTKLQELLSSTLLVDITVDGELKQMPLPIVRNMAYEKEAAVRKNAYEAELKSYEKIAVSSAACLNGIKGEVITVSKMRGYESPLHMTLLNSHMDLGTLNAMLTAMKESLPSFHAYYRKKAELLGHKNGLPFSDLFAPMGEIDMKFTYSQAKDFIVKNFSTFSRKLGDYAEYAFDHQWIDVEPQEGKRGGAFCASLHSIKESRILTNFTGSFNDVTTLAHELGHGYHGACLTEETYLNSDYPMPLAETASIFCETIITAAALKTASTEEAFAILESDISSSGQVIVDIYSRFLFESELFARRKDSSVSPKELKEMMIKAQKDAYGDGLNHEVLHPYMWVCKPHYYSADYNFYNFPYAFGLLFAKGLYAEYLKQGEAFVQKYDDLLNATSKNNIADVTKMMGVDVQNPDFWRASLQVIQKDIEKFIALNK
jgi:pepF/M3 family oligoendopeptidase